MKVAIVLTSLALFASPAIFAGEAVLDSESDDRFEYLTDSDLAEAEAQIESQISGEAFDSNEDSGRFGNRNRFRPRPGSFQPGHSRPRPRPHFPRPNPRPYPGFQPQYVQCIARDAGWEEHGYGHRAVGYDYQRTYLNALNQCRQVHGRCSVQCN